MNFLADEGVDRQTNFSNLLLKKNKKWKLPPAQPH
jgi:hypothetical protein